MSTVHINGTPYAIQAGETLSACLLRVGLAVEHPCGGRGTCRKCTVTVNGRTELACQCILCGGEVIETEAVAAIVSAVGGHSGTEEFVAPVAGAGELVLDIGTTTLALALVDTTDGRMLRVVTANNPQRAFGADIMSRISYASAHGVDALAEVLREEIRRMMERLGVSEARRLTVAGNTTMLHLFLGVDPTPMGAAPYTPAFLEAKRLPGEACGLPSVAEVVTLPGISAFVGADLVAGWHAVSPMAGEEPSEGWRLLVDLGTNAEILLFSQDKILCTAAAAGPCFEGACISSGMSAVEGAIYAYDPDGAYATVGDASPRGICGTGLVDAVAALLKNEVIDETGYMDCPVFYLTDGVGLSREDIRQYQLAKAAVHAGILALVARAGIPLSAIQQVFVAGGFAAKLRVESAVRTGLLPAAFSDRMEAVGNSSLLGACRWAAHPVELGGMAGRAEYVDLSGDPVFTEQFMEQMMFA